METRLILTNGIHIADISVKETTMTLMLCIHTADIRVKGNTIDISVVHTVRIPMKDTH